MPERVISAQRVVSAPPEAVFAVLADPREHVNFDGSGMLQAVDAGSPTLELGARFGVAMKLGAPYRVSNEVVEYERNRRIAWVAHPSGPGARLRARLFGGHRWRYELEPLDDRTRVTETWDWSGANSPLTLRLFGFPRRNVQSIERTLDRLCERFAKG